MAIVGEQILTIGATPILTTRPCLAIVLIWHAGTMTRIGLVVEIMGKPRTILHIVVLTVSWCATCKTVIHHLAVKSAKPTNTCSRDSVYLCRYFIVHRAPHVKDAE